MESHPCPVPGAGTCPVTGEGLVCPALARRHGRYCVLHAADPETWGPILLGQAEAARDAGVAVEAREPFAPPAPAPESDPTAGWTPCRHRSARWNCGGEFVAACALGLGAAGIVEAHDCAGCPRATG